MKKTALLLTSIALASSTAISISQSPAEAYNLRSCARNSYSQNPQVINLFRPINQRMIDCIPRLGSTSRRWRNMTHNLNNSISRLRMGNQGYSKVDSLTYNIPANTIYMQGTVRAKHTWKRTIPAVKTNVPYTIYKNRRIWNPGHTKWEKRCFGLGRFKKCRSIPVSVGGSYTTKRVPVTRWRLKTITPARVIPITNSATCKFYYSHNLSNRQNSSSISCGQGNLGNFKANMNALWSILNGQMPTLGDAINSVDITPPLFKTKTIDTYDSVRNNTLKNGGSSNVYFSSRSFSDWASVKNQGATVIASVFTGGAYSAEFTRQASQKFSNELRYMSGWLSRKGLSLTTEQLSSLFRTGKPVSYRGHNISVKIHKVPVYSQTCEVVRRNCLPKIPNDRLAFSVVAEPKR